MSQDMRVALTTSLNDQLVGPLRRALDEVERNLAKLQRELGGVTTASTQANQTMANMEGPKKAAKAAADLSRETNEAVRLAGRLESAWNRAGNMIKGVSAVAAGVTAANYVLKEPLQRQRSYDRQLRDLGNTAYGDLSGPQFSEKIKTLDALIQQSLRAGGGTREGALSAASTLMSQGGLTEKQLSSVMPEIMKASTAANAQPAEIASVVAAALKNGFQVDAIAPMIGKAIASGQAGGFEMKDMAKWLPKLLVAGSAIGMTGMKDYESILAYAQVSRTAAGSSDEAGNNLLNFLLKVNSNDTQNDARKNGVDLSGTLAKNRGQGMSAADAFIGILRSEMDRDPRIQKLRGQYASAGNDGERAATLKAQEQIFSGTAIGKYLSDRQALMPALAVLNNPQELARQRLAVAAGGAHTTERAFGNIAAGSDFRINQADNEKLFAQTRALEDVNSGLGKMAMHTAEVYQRFPALAAASEGATLAIGAMAAAAFSMASLAGIFTLAFGKGGAAAVAAAGGAGAATAGGAGAAVAAGAATAGGAGAGLAALPLLGILGAGALANSAMNSEGGLRGRINDRSQRLAELTELASLERNGGSAAAADKLEAQAATMRGERDTLISKLTEVMVSQQDMVREMSMMSRKSIEVRLDGSTIASTVNERNTFLARRQ